MATESEKTDNLLSKKLQRDVEMSRGNTSVEKPTVTENRWSGRLVPFVDR
jgi:hypothetical protein